MRLKGFVMEELKSKPDAGERFAGVAGVKGGGALLPVPFACYPGEGGLSADSSHFRHLRGRLEEHQAQVDSEAVEVLIRFARLLAPQPHLGRFLPCLVVRAINIGIVFPFSGAEDCFVLQSEQFIGDNEPFVQDHILQPAFADIQSHVLFLAARFHRTEEPALILGEEAQVFARLVLVQFADCGGGQGASGVLQAGEEGYVGGLSEELGAPFALESGESVLRAVCICEAFCPAPLTGVLCYEPGVGFEAGDSGDACMGTRRGKGEIDLEAAVALERFTWLPVTWLGLAVELVKDVVQGWEVAEIICFKVDHCMSPWLTGDKKAPAY